jgi:hypothetical protein
LLFLAALTALARVHRLSGLGRRIPDRLLQFGILIIAAGLLVRGVAGIGMALRGDAGTTFHRLNVVLYTPACLALFAASTTRRPAWMARPVAAHHGEGR